MKQIFRKYIQSIDAEEIASDAQSITFKLKDLNYVFYYEEKDSNYFRIVLPNIFELTEENKDKLTRVINDLNLLYKVVKLIILNDKNVWITADSFVYSRDNIERLFRRLIAVDEMVFYEFNKRIDE